MASGDPTQTGIIIWTRVTPPLLANVKVIWSVAADRDMAGVVQTGQAIATSASDWTVKIDVGHLHPGATYYYQFSTDYPSAAAPGWSRVGTLKTLPPSDSKEKLRFAIFSCSNFEKGYFNAYDHAAKYAHMDAVLHLGDYIYEYGVGRSITPALALGLTSEPRRDQLQPITETVLLDAYRIRKALYRTDTALQALHAAAPWIVIWDDHESANNSWTGGAENHNPATQGSWAARKAAAIRAFYEWTPIREPADGLRIDPGTGNPEHMARAFDYGQVARLIMLDTA